MTSKTGESSGQKVPDRELTQDDRGRFSVIQKQLDFRGSDGLPVELKAGQIAKEYIEPYGNAYDLAEEYLRDKRGGGPRYHALDLSKLEHQRILHLALVIQDAEGRKEQIRTFPKEDQKELSRMELCRLSVNREIMNKMTLIEKFGDSITSFLGTLVGVTHSELKPVASITLGSGKFLKTVCAHEEAIESAEFKPELFPALLTTTEDAEGMVRDAEAHGELTAVPLEKINQVLQRIGLETVTTQVTSLDESIGRTASDVIKKLGEMSEILATIPEQQIAEPQRIAKLQQITESLHQRDAEVEGMCRNMQHLTTVFATTAGCIFKNRKVASTIGIMGPAIIEGIKIHHFVSEAPFLSKAALAAYGDPILAGCALAVSVFSSFRGQKDEEKRAKMMQKNFTIVMKGLQKLNETVVAGFNGLTGQMQQQSRMIRKGFEQQMRLVCRLGEQVDHLGWQINQKLDWMQNFLEFGFGQLHHDNVLMFRKLCEVDQLLKTFQQEQNVHNYTVMETLRKESRSKCYQQTLQAWHELETRFVHCEEGIQYLHDICSKRISVSDHELQKTVWMLWREMRDLLLEKTYLDSVNGAYYLHEGISSVLADQIYMALPGKIENANFYVKFFSRAWDGEIVNRVVWERMACLFSSFFWTLNKSDSVAVKSFVSEKEVQRSLKEIEKLARREQGLTCFLIQTIPDLRKKYIDSLHAVGAAVQELCRRKISIDDGEIKQREIDRLEGEKIQVLREGFALTPEQEKIRQDFQEAQRPSDRKFKKYEAAEDHWKKKHKSRVDEAPDHAARKVHQVAQYFQLSRKKGELDAEIPRLRAEAEARKQGKISDFEKKIKFLREGPSPTPGDWQTDLEQQKLLRFLVENAHNTSGDLYQRLVALEESYCILSATVIYCFQDAVQGFSGLSPQEHESIFGFLNREGLITTRLGFFDRLLSNRDNFNRDEFLASMESTSTFVESSIDRMFGALIAKKLPLGSQRVETRLQDFCKIEKNEKFLTDHLEPNLDSIFDKYYSDEDVYALLQSYVGEGRVVRPLPVSGSIIEDRVLDARLIEYFFDSAKQATDLLVFVPLNVHNHWVLAVIQHFSDDNHTVLTYYDSMSEGGEMPKDMKEAFQRLFENLTWPFTCGSYPTRTQYDGYNCGPWIVEYARSFGSRSHTFPPGNIEEMRKEHQERLEESRASQKRKAPDQAASEKDSAPAAKRQQP